jgi:hypothetical protein
MEHIIVVCLGSNVTTYGTWNSYLDADDAAVDILIDQYGDANSIPSPLVYHVCELRKG